MFGPTLSASGFTICWISGSSLSMKARCIAKLPIPAQKMAMMAISIGLQMGQPGRSEEHTSEPQSLMRISYAVFCLKKKTQHRLLNINTTTHIDTHHKQHTPITAETN